MNKIIIFINELADNNIWKFIWNIKEILVGIFFFISVLNNPIFKADIAINYKEYDFSVPQNIIDYAKSFRLDSNIVFNKFLSSKKIVSVYIKNESGKIMNDIDLKINGIENLSGVYVETNSTMLNKDIEYIFRPQEQSGVIVFPNFNKMPQNAKIKLLVFCDTYQLYLDRISITSSSGRIKIDQYHEVTGLASFIDMHSYEIIYLTVVIIVGITIRRFVILK